MYQKINLTGIALLLSLYISAQPIVKSYDVSSQEKVSLDLIWGDVKIVPSENDQLIITYDLKVNDDYYNDAIEIDERNRNGKLNIDLDINFKDIPEVTTIIKKDGTKIILPKGEIFNGKRNKNVTVNQGHDLDGQIEIQVPQGVKLDIKATYGGIDGYLNSTQLTDDLSLTSVYSHVDFKIPEHTKAFLYMSTSYGSIFTDHNLEDHDALKFGKRSFGEKVEVNLNDAKDTNIYLEATYQNIYLRKAE